MLNCRENLIFFLRDYRRPILKAKHDRGRIITSARGKTFMLQAANA